MSAIPAANALMHESSLRLRERPFPAAPLAAAYFPSESLEQARRQLHRCVERAEGVGVVIGAAGMGKSLLLQVLATQFGDHFHLAHLAGAGICNRRALLQSILFELQLPYRNLEEGELRLSLMDHLQPSRECPHGMLLLIDEAHTLPLRLLEELRLLTNLVREGTPRVRLVLAGSPALDERLANPRLDSFQQRIAVRAYVHSLTIHETGEYLRHEAARCGGQAEAIFAGDAARAVHLASAGIPRLINQICDYALTTATSAAPITAAAIQRAWSELQQLPMPWSEAPVAPSSAAIEFGSLDDVNQLAEMEHIVPPAAELFGDDFADEEVVLDPYASLSIRPLAPAPQFKSPLQPALKLAHLADETVSPGLIQVIPAIDDEAAEVELTHEIEAQAYDPVYPETTEHDAIAPAIRIVAIDQGDSSPPAAHVVRGPLSGRFRNLFASLRAKD